MGRMHCLENFGCGIVNSATRNAGVRFSVRRSVNHKLTDKQGYYLVALSLPTERVIGALSQIIEWRGRTKAILRGKEM